MIARRAALKVAAGNAASLSLDLHDQWRSFEATGEWRFTPPTHVMAAFHQALEEHAGEGGVAGRGARYQRNWRTLIDGMRALGFETFLAADRQAPIIAAGSTRPTCAPRGRRQPHRHGCRQRHTGCTKPSMRNGCRSGFPEERLKTPRDLPRLDLGPAEVGHRIRVEVDGEVAQLGPIGAVRRDIRLDPDALKLLPN